VIADHRAMSLRRHVASGRGGPRAIAAVLGAALAAGVAVGIVEGLLDGWFSLLVLFPLLIGGAAGGLAAWGVARFRLRAPVVALLLGAVVAAKRGQVRVTKLESWLMTNVELKQLSDAIGRAQSKPGTT
jgi:hypothetical protein